MKPQFIHDATTSFVMWFDHHLTNVGQAYTNTTGKFYNYSDERLPSVYKVFGAPMKQWVADSSVSGANIPSGVWVNGSFSGRATDTRILDFENGRVLLSGTTTGASVTGSFAVKEFGVYLSNQDEEDILLEKKFKTGAKIGTAQSHTYAPPYDQAVPVIYITPQFPKNSPAALGGLDETTIRFNATVICDDPYQLDGVLGLFSDAQEKVFAHIPFTGSPYTEYGDVKGGTYNYTGLAASYVNQRQFFIQEVDCSKASDTLRKNIANNLYIGFIDFSVSQMRYPRQAS